jgi:hypothetical protein
VCEHLHLLLAGHADGRVLLRRLDPRTRQQPREAGDTTWSPATGAPLAPSPRARAWPGLACTRLAAVPPGEAALPPPPKAATRRYAASTPRRLYKRPTPTAPSPSNMQARSARTACS